MRSLHDPPERSREREPEASFAVLSLQIAKHSDADPVGRAPQLLGERVDRKPATAVSQNSEVTDRLEIVRSFPAKTRAQSNAHNDTGGHSG